MQREGPPPRIENVSPDLEQAVLACLAADPQARPPSAAALARELAQAPPEPPTEPIPAGPVTAETQVLPPRRTVHISQRAQIAAAAVLGALDLLRGF